MSDLIKTIAENELSSTFNTLFVISGAVAATVFSAWYGNKLELNRRQVLLLILIVYPICFGLIELSRLGAKFVAMIQFLGIKTAVNSAVKTFVLIPVVGLLTAKLLKIEWKKICDLLAIAHLIDYAICSLGCIFTGCCAGFLCPVGLYNPKIGEITFPIQIVNSLIMLLITIFLLRRTKRLNYVSDGKLFPIMIILFGSTRFITEFFMDNEKIVFGWSAISIHCIFMCIVGFGALLIMKRKEQAVLKTNES